VTTTTQAAPRVTEAAWQAQVVQLARTLGYHTYHTHDSRHSAAGFPDLVLVRGPRGPRLVFAELKAEHGRVTAAQQQWIDVLAAAGAEAHVWRPSDWDRVVEVLR
jgi:hypothetical protein